MTILVINSGSTSVKFKLFNDDESIIKEGALENIKNHNAALKAVLREIGDLRDLAAVGHRVVHGGPKFTRPLFVDEGNLPELEAFNSLAPLHNPFNLAGIRAAAEYLPGIKQAAVFDTAFFAGLPPEAKIYALPETLTENYKIYRYGFHGLSHKFSLEQAAGALKQDVNKISLITCHLGGGCSIAAIKNGTPVETSMGLTPLEGLVMLTRAGDIDPGIIFELLKAMPGEINGAKVEALYQTLNLASGVKGLTGLTDFKELLREVSLGRAQAELALNLFVNRLAKYIGAYFVMLDGRVDAVVFTGAIGAGNPMTRNRVMKKIKSLGEIPALTVKTDEELMIMREVKQLLK